MIIIRTNKEPVVNNHHNVEYHDECNKQNELKRMLSIFNSNIMSRYQVIISYRLHKIRKDQVMGILRGKRKENDRNIE